MNPPEAEAGPGERFTEARKALGLTEQDAADALNLSARVITHLETGAWDRLPAPAFTRGYIRAYAKLLGISASDLVAAYEEHVGVAQTIELEVAREAPTPSGVGELIQRQPGTVLSGAVVAVVILGAVVLWLVWPRASDEPGRIVLEPPTIEAPVAAAPVSTTGGEPSTEPVLPPPETASEPETVLEPPGPGTFATREPSTQPASATNADAMAPLGEPEDQVPVRAVTTETAAQAAGVVARPELAADDFTVSTDVGSTRTRRLTETGDDRITLEFTADCWVEVKDASEAPLYGDLGRAGDTLELVGEGPFRLLVGYAPGVALSFNGEPVALADYTRNNVAVLWLGRG